MSEFRITVTEDCVVLVTHVVNIAALAKEVRTRQLRQGDILAAWSLLDLASEATEVVRDEILAALVRHFEGRTLDGRTP